MPARAGAGHTYPSIKRRLICMVYEALLLAGVAFFAGLLFLGATGGTAPSGWTRHALQVYLFLVIGLYFVVSWYRAGQTLPMKTWKMRLVGTNGARVTLRQAILRYLCAWPCLLLGGVGIVYASFDRRHQFLHDRLAGTSLVASEW